MQETHPCYVCEGDVDIGIYSVVFTWWDEERICHPSCIQTFAVGKVARHFDGQDELFPAHSMRNALMQRDD